jgi:hypothetical protein
MSSDRAVRQGITNYAQRISFRTQKDANGVKRVTGYSLKTGLLIIDWAHESNKWEDVDYRQLNDVRNLAAARVLRAIGSLRSQARSDLPGNIDFNSFLNRADKLEEEIINKWMEHTKAVAIRA